jgi:hypothetical protein
MYKVLEWTRALSARGDDAPNAKTLEYYSVFWVGGVLALIQKWLKDGMDTPVLLMAKMLARLTAGTRQT